LHFGEQAVKMSGLRYSALLPGDTSMNLKREGNCGPTLGQVREVIRDYQSATMEGNTMHQDLQ